MKYLILLALLAVAFCRPSGDEDNKGKRHRFEPEFLKEASKDGKKAWEKIWRNDGLTRKELKEQLQAWAKKEGGKVETAVTEFEAKHEKRIEESKKNITEAIKKLPEVMASLQKLREDDKLTRKQLREKTHELLDKESDQVAAAARALIFSHSRRGGRRWGGRRHGKGGKDEPKEEPKTTDEESEEDDE